MTEIELTTERGRPTTSIAHRLSSVVKLLGWTPSSYFMLSVFFILLFVIGVVWWPLV